jgi:hypothetical protein
VLAREKRNGCRNSAKNSCPRRPQAYRAVSPFPYLSTVWRLPTAAKSCAPTAVAKELLPDPLSCGVRTMNKSAAGFDYDRYRKLLAEATDEPRRLALIQTLIDEKARDRLARQSIRNSFAEEGPKTKFDTDPRPKADLRMLDLSALAANLLRKRVTQTDRPVEDGPIRR